MEGLFYNPNIHPFKEFKRRIGALNEFADHEKLPVEVDTRYGLREYLRQVVFKENDRCATCYDMRLNHVALYAREKGMDAFTTTLLYSKYQNHQLIREKGEAFSRRHGIAFLYEDFRTGWQEGVDRSIEMDLYRQPYCGCIYSEQERYDKSLR